MKPVLLLAVALSVALMTPALAQTPAATPALTPEPPVEAALTASGSALVERNDEGLMIDWTHLVMQIKGLGMAPERGTLSQRRLMSKRTALADGYRQMAEAVSQLRVNAEAFVRDLTAVDDAARQGINDMVRDARTTDIQYWADGSVEVTMEIPLAATPNLTKVLLGTPMATSSPLPGNPSGIVLDARNTGAQPALRPHVRDARLKVFTPDEQPFRYYHLPEGAKEFVGDSPLKLKVKRAYGTTHADMLLADPEATKLKAALKAQPQLPIAILL